jgi:hypothetical protein
MAMGVRGWLDRWGDWFLAVVLAASAEYEIWVRPLPNDQAVTAGRPAAAGLLVLVTLPLAWRRRAPVAVLFIVIAVAVCALFAIHPSRGPLACWIAGIAAFYSVAANCTERRALLGGGIGLAALAVLITAGQPGQISRARWRSSRWPGWSGVTCGSGAASSPGFRTARRGPSRNGRPRRARRSPPNAGASPANSTTSSRTASA